MKNCKNRRVYRHFCHFTGVTAALVRHRRTCVSRFYVAKGKNICYNLIRRITERSRSNGSFGNNEAEAARKRNLKELEDKRVRFAEALAQRGFQPEHCLFVQRDGRLCRRGAPGRRAVFAHRARPRAEEDFTFRAAGRARAYTEDVFIKSEGLGGILGFGKKGGVGFKLVVVPEEGEPLEMELISGLGTYLEIRPEKKVKNALLGVKRRRGNANFVWDFMPIEREAVNDLQSRWLAMINGEGV